MKGFQSIAEAMDVRQFYAVGTAALRDAEDGEAFVKEVYDLTGFNVASSATLGAAHWSSHA